jgi:hypothetical protein
MGGRAIAADPQDFSVVIGGPLFQLFRKAHLSGDGLELVGTRMFVLLGLSWLPLLILSAVQGLALGSTVLLPFLHDIEAQARILLFLPLLITGEIVVHQRLRSVANQFLQRELIPDDARPRFDAAVASAMRLRNSVVAEVAMIAVVYLVGLGIVWRHVSLDVATWFATPDGDGKSLTLAGFWFVYFTLPLTQFLLLRWYYRLFIWTRFLWQVSRIQLRLVPTHPDRIGGLGFLSSATAAFSTLALAHGAFVSGWIAARIFLQQATLLDFKFVIIALAVWMLLLFLAPFLLFSSQLAQARRQGERDYGPLAQRYSRQFDTKWVHGNAPPPRDEPLLGSADIQSLADMGNVYTVVTSMRFTPITRQAVVQLLGATLAPIAPLTLTMMPLAEAAKLLFGILM